MIHSSDTLATEVSIRNGEAPGQAVPKTASASDNAKHRDGYACPVT
jgi:hypothetical protein